MNKISLSIFVFCSLFYLSLSLKSQFDVKVELFNLTDIEINKYWLDYKVKFNKSFSNKTEENLRRKRFVDKLVEINRHNENYNLGIDMLNSTNFEGFSNNSEILPTFSLGLSLEADLSPEEFLNQFLGLKLPEFSKTHETESFNSEIFLGNTLIPEEFDWRDYPGVLGNVKNQYPCGNCWIYSALSALESQIKIKQNRTVSLSEQNVFDCSDPNQSCNRGHFMAFAYDYIIKNGGVDTESNYPSCKCNFRNECRYNPVHNGATMKRYEFVNYNKVDEEKLKRAVYIVGPISVTINVAPNNLVLDSWRYYKGGFYFHNQCIPGTDHAVTVVGYGKDDRYGEYFIIKNSWGTDWGDNGYMYIARNRNMCGVGSYALYPIL